MAGVSLRFRLDPDDAQAKAPQHDLQQRRLHSVDWRSFTNWRKHCSWRIPASAAPWVSAVADTGRLFDDSQYCAGHWEQSCDTLDCSI